MNGRTFRLSTGDLLGSLFLIIIFALLARTPLWYTDIWAHAKYGEYYWTHGFFEKEPLSTYSDQEAPFLHVAWLTQVLYYGLYELGASVAGGDAESQLTGGAEALRTFHLLVMLGCFVLLWLALKRIGGVGGRGWALLGLLVFLMSLDYGTFVQRPQTFGLFFIMAVLYALSTPQLTRPAYLWLPLMFAFWANMHGSFLIGLIVIGLHTLGRAIERGYRDREVIRLVMLGICCFLATWINPYGPWLYQKIVQFSAHPNLKTMAEWEGMQFTRKIGIHWAYLMSLILLAMARLLGKRPMGAAGWLVALAFAVWPWLQIRTLLWWWAVVVWILARLGPGLNERYPGLFKLPEGEATRGKAWVALGCSIIAILLLPPIQLTLRGVPATPDRVVSEGTPWRLGLELKAEGSDEGRWYPELRQAVREHYPQQQFQGAIFASETTGEFLFWALPRELPVLMFTHAHLFTPEFWGDLIKVKFAMEGWEKIVDDHRVNLIVVEAPQHEKLADWLRKSSEWIVVEDVPAEVKNRPLLRIVALRKVPR